MNLIPRRRKRIAPGVAVLLVAGWTVLFFPCVGLTGEKKITPRQLVKNLKTKSYSGEPVELRFEDATLAEILAKFEVIRGFKLKIGRLKLGMNHPMGPLELADFIGLDVVLTMQQALYDGFKEPKYRPCPLLVSLVEVGHLGSKTGRGFYEYK